MTGNNSNACSAIRLEDQTYKGSQRQPEQGSTNDERRSTIDQVKRNKSSLRGTMTDNRTAHGQVNYFAYIYYNLWNCPIVDRRRRSPIVAAAAAAAATSPCIIVNQVSWEGDCDRERASKRITYDRRRQRSTFILVSTPPSRSLVSLSLSVRVEGM